MSNEEKIKNMTTMKLAEFIHDVSANCTKITTCEEDCDECEFSQSYCILCMAEWLERESDNEIGGIGIKNKYVAAGEMVDILTEIREAVWDRDIPSPTCPEYIEHHNDCLEIINLIDSKIKAIGEV